MKKIWRLCQITLFALVIAGVCRVPVWADGSQPENYRLLLWYDYYGADSNVNVKQQGEFSSTKPIRIKYGNKLIEADTAKGYIPRYFELDEGWANGTQITLQDIPAPDGYELCFSHQPTFQIGKGMYENQDPANKNVDICIPVKKIGEKTNFSQSNILVNILFTIDNGSRQYKYTGKQLKPPVEVFLNTIPLREDIDYTVSYGPNKEMGEGTVTVTGKGIFTGSRTKTFDILSFGSVIPGNSAVLPNGSVFNLGNVKYKVKSSNTVTITGLKNKKKSVIKVPDTVKKGGKTYKVTAIAANAFKNSSAKSAVIGKNVASIGAKAFYHCKKLRKITVKTSKLRLKKIGKNAFKGIYKKAKFKVPKKKIRPYKKIFRKRGAGKKIKVTR